MNNLKFTFDVEGGNMRAELSTYESKLADKIISSDIGVLFPRERYDITGLCQNHFLWKAGIEEVISFLEKTSMRYSLVIYFAE